MPTLYNPDGRHTDYPASTGEMGLIAYECPKFGYVTSVLLQPDDPQSLPIFKRYAPSP
jgi:hypothetical protein